MSQTKSAKAGQGAEGGECESYWEPPQPVHEVVKDTKRCSTGRGKSWMSSRAINIASMPADRALKQSKGWGRYQNRFRRLHETLLSELETWASTVENRLRYQASHSRKQQNAGSHCVC